LFAVAQGGVEDDDAVLLGLDWSGHGIKSFSSAPGALWLWALVGPVASCRPLSAQAQTPSRPSGGDKEQQPVEKKGSAGTSLGGSPLVRSKIVANRHALPSAFKVAENGKDRINP